MHNVFISYSRQNSGFVDKLDRELQGWSVPIWLDRRDLPVSMPWFDDVRYAISGALLVVTCRSAEWERSENCALEFRAAEEQRVPMLDVAVTDDPAFVAERIRRRYDEERQTGALRAEVTRRTADWERSGKRKGHLARGRWLQRARREVATNTDVAPVVAAFLSTSLHRDRRRRFATRLGALVIVTVVIAGRALTEVQKHANEQITASAVTALEQQMILGLLDVAPYESLREAAARVSARGESFVDRDHLMRALAVPVPETSRTMSSAEAAALSDECSPTLSCTSSAAGLRATWSPPTGVVTIRRASGDTYRRIDVRKIQSLELSPDGRFLAVGRGWDIDVYTVASGDPVTRLSTQGVVADIRWSADGERLAASTKRRRSVWKWRAVTVIADRPGVWFTALGPPDSEGDVVAVARDGRMFDVHGRGGSQQVARIAAGDVYAAPFTRDGRQLLIVGAKRIVLASTSGRELASVPNQCAATSATFSRDERSVWLACSAPEVRHLSVPGFDRLAGVQLGDRSAAAVVSRGSEMFVATSASEVLVTSPGRAPQSIFSRDCGTAFRALTANGSGDTFFAVGDGAGKIGCAVVGHKDLDGGWRIDNHILPRRPGQSSRAAAFSPNGRVVAVGYADGTVTTLTMPNQTPGWLWTGTPGAIRALRFTPDGDRIVVATREGVVASMPACPGCESGAAMVTIASRRIAKATRLGLMERRSAPPRGSP